MIWGDLWLTIKRREDLGKRMNEEKLQCPSCGTRQVQLMQAEAIPARWRCRHCKTWFTWEGGDEIEILDRG